MNLVFITLSSVACLMVLGVLLYNWRWLFRLITNGNGAFNESPILLVGAILIWVAAMSGKQTFLAKLSVWYLVTPLLLDPANYYIVLQPFIRRFRKNRNGGGGSDI